MNVRDIEQGLEQAKRLPSQDILMKLLPAQEPQMNDLVLTVTRSKNVYGTISFDDSRRKDTGKLQLYGNVGIDQISPFIQCFSLDIPVTNFVYYNTWINGTGYLNEETNKKRAASAARFLFVSLFVHFDSMCIALQLLIERLGKTDAARFRHFFYHSGITHRF